MNQDDPDALRHSAGESWLEILDLFELERDEFQPQPRSPCLDVLRSSRAGGIARPNHESDRTGARNKLGREFKALGIELVDQEAYTGGVAARAM